MFLLLSFAWQRTVLTTLKENNSYKRIILKSKSEMWKVVYLSLSIEIYIKIYSLLKCQHNLSSKEQSLFSQIRYGVFGLRLFWFFNPLVLSGIRVAQSFVYCVMFSPLLALYCLCIYTVNSLYRQAFLEGIICKNLYNSKGII
jgi:hypothetical protein